MNSKPTDPRYEFRLFGHEFGRVIDSLLTTPQKQRATLANTALSGKVTELGQCDEGVQTYILAAGEQSYSIKLRDHQVDTKVLLRYQQGLERWQPHLQLAFPLAAAFLHEFLFAWLEVEPPSLRRAYYTEAQFLQELIIPYPALRAVAVHKQRRHFAVNRCQMEITALTIDERYHTHTVAVESADAGRLLDTLVLLDLHTFANTNYLVGLSRLVGMGATAETLQTAREPDFMPSIQMATEPALLLVR